MTGAARSDSRGRKLKSDNNVALGDILTLIFGFFVLMVTLNKFAIIQDSGPYTSGNQKMTDGRRAESSVSVEGSSKLGFLTIPEKAFLSIALGKEPLHIPEIFRNNTRTITVEACVPKRGVQKDDQRLWERSAARAEKIGMLLTFAGVAADRIAVRALGSHCERFGENNKEKHVVAVSLR